MIAAVYDTDYCFADMAIQANILNRPNEQRDFGLRDHCSEQAWGWELFGQSRAEEEGNWWLPPSLWPLSSQWYSSLIITIQDDNITVEGDGPAEHCQQA